MNGMRGVTNMPFVPDMDAMGPEHMCGPDSMTEGNVFTVGRRHALCCKFHVQNALDCSPWSREEYEIN